MEFRSFGSARYKTPLFPVAPETIGSRISRFFAFSLFLPPSDRNTQVKLGASLYAISSDCILKSFSFHRLLFIISLQLSLLYSMLKIFRLSNRFARFQLNIDQWRNYSREEEEEWLTNDLWRLRESTLLSILHSGGRSSNNVDRVRRELTIQTFGITSGGWEFWLQRYFIIVRGAPERDLVPSTIHYN